jgi:phage baseplate assembly protein W
MSEEQSFLGTGWSFPPSFQKGRRGVKMISDEEDIKSSLHILLSTKLGERVMVPKYGCNLEDLIFENLDTTLQTYVVDLIRTAILYFEPRIDAEKITLTPGTELEGKIDIEVTYRVRSTNSRHNYVFPFYKEEGTNL